MTDSRKHTVEKSDSIGITDSAQEVAAKLTKAQRDLLAALPDNGIEATEFWNGEHKNFHLSLMSFRALAALGLAGIFGEATPLGIEVRRILQEQEHAQ